MARIKKFADTQSSNLNPVPKLSSYSTFITDTNPSSQYFRITEFKDTFTGGKNGFLIAGSEHLLESTEIKIQIIDVEGNPIYYEPGNGVPEYYEGISKVVAVYVYEDTPIGPAKITILGELKTYIDENNVTQPVPEEWKNVYNVKWEKSFEVNRLLSNEDKVRFYRRPKIVIDEIVKPIFSNVVQSVTQTGNIDGFAQVPAQGESLSNFKLPTSYLVQINDGLSAWTGSIVGSTLSVPSIGYTSEVSDIIDKTNLILKTPYTINGLVSDFSNKAYTSTFNHVEGVDNLITALTGSFAKITIADLTTFVGDVARVKIFRKSQSDLSDFQFIQEIQLESNEILRDLESTTKNEEYYGSFDSVNFLNYWLTSSNDIDTQFNQSFLYNSVKLDAGSTAQQFYTSKSLDITSGSEYSLDFNLRLLQNTSANNYLKAYLSGSYNSQSVKQTIVTVTSDGTITQKSNITSNFKADKIENPKLYFEVRGDDWYLADVSLRASQETAFSPDEITFIQSIPRTLPRETFDFRFYFYDINNNFIPVLVEASKTFDGGNLNRINKSLELVPSSLYFQFDSGSGFGNPVPPTTITIDVIKNFLTGSVTYTSRSFDFYNNELSQSQYTPGQFPGLLLDRETDQPYLTVQNFTGSREDIPVQFIIYTGECEGATDSFTITRVIDGKGGVNYEIRPYRGTVIRNNDPSGSLEVQAIRIDGINEQNLRTGLPAGRSLVQMHVQSGSNYLLLSEASSSGFVKGIYPGTSGSKEINYNAIFNRDSIDGQRTVYLIPSGSSNYSASILTTLTLTDLLDGLDAGVFAYDNDTFTINPRLSTIFAPPSASATASFYRRGTNINPISASVFVFPSMSINKDYVPEYWLYYYTSSVNADLRVSATDDFNNIIPSLPLGSYVASPLTQSRTLTVTATYLEPYSSESVSVSKVFSIVPEGKPGDETIIYEISPVSVNLNANARGVVTSYSSSITDIRLKQGSRYLSFTSSRVPGTFWVAQSSITGSAITPGTVLNSLSPTGFIESNTGSLRVGPASNMTQLSGSVTYNLEIQPFYTSSVYTGSIVQQYNKTLEGAEPIQIVITPSSANIKADEVGYVTDYSAANTTIFVKEGNDFLLYTGSQQPGTWKINSIETRSPNGAWNIRTGSLSANSATSSLNTFNRFDHPFVSASATYTIQVYPYALGAGHLYTSSIFTRTQTFNKAIAPPNARKVDFKATSYSVNYNRDGVKTTPEGGIDLTATAFNTTGSVYFYFYYVEADGSETFYDGPLAETSIGSKEQFITVDGGDAAGPGENKTWKVKITDGKNPSYFNLTQADVRAEGQLTIAGIKGGADAYKVAPTNESTTISGDLWTKNLTGTEIKLPTFKGVTELTNVTTAAYPAYTFPDDYDYLGNVIGKLGYSSASIFYKNNFITQSAAKITTSPASMPDLTDWRGWGVSQSANIVYKLDYENGRQTQFVTQSLAVSFTPPAPYSVLLTNENSAIVFRVSGELDFATTATSIRVFRGNTELTNKPSGFTSPQWDAYEQVGYKEQCRVSIAAKSSHITLGGGYTVGSYISGTPASMPAIVGWTDPENNLTGTIVYQIEPEYSAAAYPSKVIYKTQSLSVQYEGATGPGIVMRGEWANTIDYIGSVETTNNRRDAVTYLATVDDTHYYAAISGSGPNTYVNPTTSTFYVGASPPAGYNLIGPQAPTPQDDNDYWQYLGQEEFFVAAKIAIFEESYVKNTINVGTVNGTGAFANIVIAGGRTDPYIAIGQNATVGTSGFSGTTLNPGGSVIGYDMPGIFLGIYETPVTNGTNGRFSIKDNSGTRYMRWDGSDLQLSGRLNAGNMLLGPDVNGTNDGLYLNANNYWYDTGTSFKVGGSTNYLEWDGTTLTLRGSLKQTSAGVNEGRLMGAWASGVAYLTNDIVTYSGNTWTSNSDHTSTNNTNAGTGYPGYGPWTIAPISAKLLRMEVSSQVFIEAKDGTLSPNWIELTVNKQNISATTSWTTSPSVTLYNASTGGSTTTTGDTVYLRKADFGANTLVEVTATADSISDTISIARVQEGTDGLTIILSNESHTLPAASDGTISSYNDSGTNILIYEGATQLDYDGSGTSAGKWTVSAAGSSITPGAISDGGNYAVVANHSNMTADQATVTYTITGQKINGDTFPSTGTLTKVQSLTKSKSGAAGAAGAAGAGVVYRGEWRSGVDYFKTSTRQDVVKGSNGEYYLAKSSHTSAAGQRPIDGASYATYWDSFGATFSSVATDILFAQDVYSNRTVNVGVSGSGPAIVLNADASNSGSNPFLSIAQGTSQGYDNLGIFLGYDTGSAKLSLKSNTGNYLRWTGTELQVQGKVNATDGYLGSGNDVWKIENQLLYSSASVGQIRLNASRPAIEIYDSGSNLTVDINTNLNLSPVTPITLISTGSLSGMPTSQETPPDVTSLTDSDTDINSYAYLYFGSGYLTSSNSSSIYVPSNASGLSAQFNIATAGTQKAIVDIVGSGGITSAQLYVNYGVNVYWIAQNVSQNAGNEEYVGTVGWYTSDTFTDYSATTTTQTLEASMVRTFTLLTTLKGGGYYRFKPYVLIYSVQASGQSDVDIIPRPTHTLNISNEVPAFSGTYFPRTPQLSSVSSTVASSKTEIIAGGFQVAFSNDRYVQIPRGATGAMLKIAGGLELISGDGTTGITADSGSVNVYDTLYAPNFTNNTFNLGTTTGYSKLVNGLIVQAGYANGTAVPTTVTFPLAFPSKCLAVTCATDRNNSGANGYNHVTNVSTTGCQLVLDAAYDGWWIAVGY